MRTPPSWKHQSGIFFKSEIGELHQAGRHLPWMSVCAHIAAEHPTLIMLAGIEPIGIARTGVAVGDDDAHGTVRLVVGGVFVDADAEEAEVERLHGGIRELQIPRLTLW